MTTGDGRAEPELNHRQATFPREMTEPSAGRMKMAPHGLAKLQEFPLSAVTSWRALSLFPSAPWVVGGVFFSGWNPCLWAYTQ